MIRIKLFFAAIILFSISSCVHEGLPELDNKLSKLIGNKEHLILPDENDYASIPQSPVNPLTKEKIQLGKLLFFEPVFANENKLPEQKFTFTCSSCHVPEAGFRPGRMQGVADGGYGFGVQGEKRIKYPLYHNDSIDAQGARPLAVLNTAFVENTMWNGSFGSEGLNQGTEEMWGVFDPGTKRNEERLGALEGQNIEGLIVHRMNYTKEIITNAGYKALFDEAFPDMNEEDRYSRRAASFAISAYLRQLVTNQAPFQKWLKGEITAMTEQQKRGAVLFFGKAGCNGCHFEKNLGSMRFEALAVDDLYEHGGLKTGPNDRRNLGRGGFTGREADMFKFRTPQLYNLGDSGPYFHGGSKETLEDVVKYFNDGIPENKRVPKEQLSYFIRPLGLSDQEVADVAEFVKNGLRDPNLKRYVPEKVISGLCFPNNDPISKNDMGCK
ncbi:MAG: c-type cytochrome [Saprospiraceae bacterium]|nr:c-type cytochrome [Saprospiraceae bacterium]